MKNKIMLVISREYFTRVRKKSFLVMTILGPLLIAALYAVPLWLANKTDEVKKIALVDETGFFVSQLHSGKEVKYSVSIDMEASKAKLEAKEIDAILHIPRREYTIPQHAFLLYSSSEPGMMIQSKIQDDLQAILRDKIMSDVLLMKTEDISSIKNSKIKLASENITTGKSGFVEVKSVLGVALGVLVFVFIFMFGSLVMRGVIEEKTSRIIEVMISSIKPFQLMMGKIVGIALVGFTQFLLWIILSFLIISGIQLANADIINKVKEQQISSLTTKGPGVTDLPIGTTEDLIITKSMEGLLAIDFKVIIGVFLFYFLFGYLLYASFFAAIGSLIENETDSNQFVMPITVPLILVFVMLPTIINNPTGPIAFWLSLIPFTSPIVMMVRIPFGVPYWQVGISMILLIGTFLASTWLAAKIYRTGILMYGKKVSYAEVWKWLRYKN